MTAWMGGAIDRVEAGETAFGHRGARALTWLIGCSGEEEIEPAAGWVRRLFDATAPFASGGVYVNALDAGRPARDAYAPAVWERLLAVKRRYDPDGVFDAHGLQTPSRSA
jgi:FAD/FMN-containing dehydrogenase